MVAAECVGAWELLSGPDSSLVLLLGLLYSDALWLVILGWKLT